MLNGLKRVIMEPRFLNDYKDRVKIICTKLALIKTAYCTTFPSCDVNEIDKKWFNHLMGLKFDVEKRETELKRLEAYIQKTEDERHGTSTTAKETK